MLEDYFSAGKDTQIINVVKKSRFICYVHPADSTEKAYAFLETIRKKHKDANHNVWAWRVGHNVPEERCSDDGEPTGTAGLPVLEVLRKKGLTDCVVVVSRYFGGILLGAGGLVRAYTESAVQGLTDAGAARFCLYQKLSVSVSYPMLGLILKIFEDVGARLEEPEFDVEVTVQGWVLPSKRPAAEKRISELGGGHIDIQWDGEAFLRC